MTFIVGISLQLTRKESRHFVVVIEWKMERDEKREWDKGGADSCDLKMKRSCLQSLFPYPIPMSSCFHFLFLFHSSTIHALVLFLSFFCQYIHIF